MILADTGAVVALIDASEQAHATMRELFEAVPRAWLLPWAILPEVDYLVASRLGDRLASRFHDDLVAGAFAVELGVPGDLARAAALRRKHAALRLGLVDSVVLAIAERLEVEAIATFDLRHFGAVKLAQRPRLLPRDL